MEHLPLTTKELHLNLEKCLRGFLEGKQLKGAILHIHGDGSEPIDWKGAVGNLETTSPYFLSEVSFMHVAAMTLKLRARGKWKLADKIIRYLPEEDGKNLLVWRNKDLSTHIEIGHLLSHRSGLGDFFTHKKDNHPSFLDRLEENTDFSWNQQATHELIRSSDAAFAPGNSKKAFFSRSNYYLLGLAIEHAGNKTLESLLKEFQLRPLGLNQTYTYDNPTDRTPVAFYYKDTRLSAPNFMQSFGPVGGMVSTAKDSMAFLRAFFHGSLFPAEYFTEMETWLPAGNGQFYGLGLGKYEPHGLPAFFSKQPALLGMTGFSGAFALYVPEKKAYFTGTVNQMDDPHLAYKLVHKVSKVLP
ncbi:serine hydrolase domain-containing protein [Lunatibacter salilacus]|uniref:serine hydrolase domain-containing protein n=1 Tax=Lunatibacter salilacus TaxID=2483804 RepID=UPI00131AF220|nr:serine hydrolase domain-containing protein [Lunatibacter salilacus]